MSLIPDFDLLKQEVTKLKEQLSISTEHLMHIHNLQHTVIQEILNTNLYRTYDNLGPEKVIEFEYDETPIKMFLPSGPSDLIQRDIIWKKSFFHPESLEMIRELMPMAGERILDIGAYIGNHTVFFSKICGASGVESFEPVKSSYRALARNTALNNVNSILHNIGLGAQAGEARVNLNTSNAGGSTLQEVAGGGVKIAALDELQIAPFHAMKIDVEGMAHEVLLGSRGTIEKNKPSIVVEAFPHEFDVVNGILQSMKYRKIGQVSDDHVYIRE